MDETVDKSVLASKPAARLDRRWLIFLLGGVLIVAAVLTYGWYRTLIYPSTDDAYVGANVTDIASMVNGKVSEVLVSDNSRVKAGEVLFRIDSRPFDYAVNLAQANLDLATQSLGANGAAVDAASATIKQREATLVNARAEAERARKLHARHDMSQADLDSAEMKLKAAEAGLTAARADLSRAEAELGGEGKENASVRAAIAALEQAQYNRAQTEIRAPAAGYIAGLSLRPGASVRSGQALFHLVETGSWWMAANFKETSLKRLRIGQTARVRIDMCSGPALKGTIVGISPGSGAAFSLFPAENATGNWVKVTQRFAVRVRIDDPPRPSCPLRVGASGRVKVDTAAAS